MEGISTSSMCNRRPAQSSIMRVVGPLVTWDSRRFRVDPAFSTAVLPTNGSIQTKRGSNRFAPALTPAAKKGCVSFHDVFRTCNSSYNTR